MAVTIRSWPRERIRQQFEGIHCPHRNKTDLGVMADEADRVAPLVRVMVAEFSVTESRGLLSAM